MKIATSVAMSLPSIQACSKPNGMRSTNHRWIVSERELLIRREQLDEPTVQVTHFPGVLPRTGVTVAARF